MHDTSQYILVIVPNKIRGDTKANQGKSNKWTFVPTQSTKQIIIQILNQNPIYLIIIPKKLVGKSFLNSASKIILIKHKILIKYSYEK